jgi:hypothetical protein
VFEPPAFGLVRDYDDAREFISQVEAITAQRPTPAEFLPRFITAVGGDASRLPDPLPPPLVRAASVQMNGRTRSSSSPAGTAPCFDAVCDPLEEQLAAERAVLPGAGHSIPTLGPPVNDRLATFWKAVDEPA